MKKHINALLGFVCYTIGVIAAAYYGLWKMLVLPLLLWQFLFWQGT